MKILTLQINPCCRSYKISRAALNADADLTYDLILEAKGYDQRFEKLGYVFAEPAYWREHLPRTLIEKIRYFVLDERLAGRRLQGIIRDSAADLVNSRGPDRLGYFAHRFGSVPVVHDVHDLYSIFPRRQTDQRNVRYRFREQYMYRKQLRWEKYTHEELDGLIYTSSYMLDYARSIYRISCETVIVPNAVLAEDVPEERLPKLSKTEGGRHLVYVGDMNQPKLEKLLDAARVGLHVHIYPIGDPAELADLRKVSSDQPLIHWKDTLPYRRLLLEFTQYDFGVIFWYRGATDEIFQTSLPNKIFEYLVAGLPVIVGPFRSLSDFVESRGVGFSVEEPEQILDRVNEEFEVPFREEYTMEYYMPDLLDFYRRVIRERGRPL
ncbi:MAG: glycosyltransferase [Candidatus Eisenbacteria sp.]|nr:glycosyltransferase [Candidatus Eisenbacteria bacterium]